MLKKVRKLEFVFGLFFFLSIALTGLTGCEQPEPEGECSYDINGSGNIESVRVFYPCEMEDTDDMYNATTLSGGFTNTKENMYWLGEHLRDEGLVVFAISARNNLTVDGYTKAHLQGFDLMEEENGNTASLVYHKLDKRALVGYSMGGGGVLNAADDLADKLDAMVAIAPYRPDSNLSAVDAASMMIVGQNDTVAPPHYSEDAFDAISDSTVKCLIELADFPHGYWMDNYDSSGTVPKQMIADWLDLNLNGNTAKLSTFINPPSEVVINENNL